MELDAEKLIAACGEEASEAGISIRATLEPLGGEGAPVKPATYEGGRFQTGRRWWGEGADRREVGVLVIDNEPSQANRLEAALEQLREELGLPEIVLDLSSAASLPPHLPKQISSFRFPHRNADAYLRDAVLDGARFMDTDTGRGIFDATGDRSEALLQWFPQALLFGFWQSHLGKKRSQAKLARAWTSEIIGIEPAAEDIRREATKGDPLTLNIDEKVDWSAADQSDWAVLGRDENPSRESAKKAERKLSEVGHGPIITRLSEQPPGAVSFREVMQQATLSFAALRRIRSEKGVAEARAMLAALGLVAHVAAFGRSFSLRSGAELHPRTSDWTWLGAKGDEALEVLDLEAAKALFAGCADRAEATGLPVGTQWAEPLKVEPAPNLLDAIQKSWPVG